MADFFAHESKSVPRFSHRHATRRAARQKREKLTCQHEILPADITCGLMISISTMTTLIPIIVSSILARCFILIQSTHKQRHKHSREDAASYSPERNEHQNTGKNDEKNKQPIKTMVVMGSGGHTTEMINLLQELDPKSYAPVVYVVANSDTTSVMRLKRYIDEAENTSTRTGWEGRYPIENETSRQNKGRVNAHINAKSTNNPKLASVYRLPRPREVHQSYISSILPTLRSIYHTLHLLQREQPNLILANGPGMCVPFMYLVFLSRVFGLTIGKCKIIFVESLCRVETLSLSGKLVYPIVDQFVVHWASLKKKYPLVEVCDMFVCQDENRDELLNKR